MAVLIFEARDAVLTLEQHANTDAPAVISIRLSPSPTPAVYVSGGQDLANAVWIMTVREQQAAAAPCDEGTLVYSDNDGKAECLVTIMQSAQRFGALLAMLKGGHTSEIVIEVGGLQHRADYSNVWDTEAMPALPVLRVGFEFPLPQSEA
jgi:hypothetical protein